MLSDYGKIGSVSFILSSQIDCGLVKTKTVIESVRVFICRIVRYAILLNPILT